MYSNTAIDTSVHASAVDAIADVLTFMHTLHDLATKDGSLEANNILLHVQQHIAATPLGQIMVEYLPRLKAMLRPALPYCTEDVRNEFITAQLRKVISGN